MTGGGVSVALKWMLPPHHARAQVAIVGRTGSGKSTLLLALWRMVDYTGECAHWRMHICICMGARASRVLECWDGPAVHPRCAHVYTHAGTISIDGTDTRLLPLDYLRKHLTIIPQVVALARWGGARRSPSTLRVRVRHVEQEPVLFEGTVRFNIDPAGEYDVAVSPPTPPPPLEREPTGVRAQTVRGAASACELPRFLLARAGAAGKASAPGAVDDCLGLHVESGGRNFSAGQRQLVVRRRRGAGGRGWGAELLILAVPVPRAREAGAGRVL